jgi:hypothetical protein
MAENDDLAFVVYKLALDDHCGLLAHDGGPVA